MKSFSPFLVLFLLACFSPTKLLPQTEVTQPETPYSELNNSAKTIDKNTLQDYLCLTDRRLLSGKVNFSASALALITELHNFEKSNENKCNSTVLAFCETTPFGGKIKTSNFFLPKEVSLHLTDDLFILSEGDVVLDGDIFGEQVNGNADGQHLVIKSEGRIIIRGNISLSDGGDAQSATPLLAMNTEHASISQSLLSAHFLPSLSFSRMGKNKEMLIGGTGGSLFLSAREIIIEGQVKVGNGGRGQYGGRGGHGGSITLLSGNTFHKNDLKAGDGGSFGGDGGNGGDALAFKAIGTKTVTRSRSGDMIGGNGGHGGDAPALAFWNPGTNGANASGPGNQTGGNGGPGGTAPNPTTGCDGGLGGNGSSDDANGTGGHGGNGGAGALPTSTLPDGGDGGDGGDAGSGYGGDNASGSGGVGKGGIGGIGGGGRNAWGGGFGIDGEGGLGGRGGDGGYGYGGNGYGSGGNGTGGKGGVGGGGGRGAGNSPAASNGGGGGNGGDGGNGEGGHAGNSPGTTKGGDGYGGNGGVGGAAGDGYAEGGDGGDGGNGGDGCGGNGDPIGTGYAGSYGNGGSGGGTYWTGGMNGSTGNNGSNGTSKNGSLLPVVFINFEAKLQGKKVYLIWATTSESNNKGFHIQHSTNGRNWKSLDFLEGRGSTLQEHKYSYLHPTPHDGVNYYRLQQMDLNGVFEFSKTITVNAQIETQNFSITPNPIGKQELLTIRFGQASKGNLNVFGANGQRVFHYSTEEAQSEIQLNLPDLPKGIYIAEWLTGQKRFVQRLILE